MGVRGLSFRRKTAGDLAKTDAVNAKILAHRPYNRQTLRRLSCLAKSKVKTPGNTLLENEKIQPCAEGMTKETLGIVYDNHGRDATMFLPKLNSLLTGVFVAMFIAVGTSVMAQDGLRLWKPYDPQSFGGGRRSNDGMYASLSGIYWTISTPKGGYIGATTANGQEDVRWVYSGNGFNKVYAQTNSVKINMLDPKTTLGTRFEVGNRRGHHGWLVGGYGLPDQSHRMSVNSMSLTIRDEGNLTLQPFATTHSPSLGGWVGGLEYAAWLLIWDRGHNSLYDPTATGGSRFYPFADWQVVDIYNGASTSVTGIGYLWGYFEHSFETEDDGRVITAGLLAPLPIWFANADITVSSSHMSAEAMYTYRAHPFTWGSMELLAGGRYWDFDDKFGFFGTGPGGAGAAAQGNNVDDYGVVSVLSDMTINARAQNRVFGPQVGMKLSRQNARWTFSAEGRLTAGINAQTVRTEGNISTNYDNNGQNTTSMNPAGHDPDTSIPKWMPIGLQYSNNNFGHKQSKTYFSPIGEFRMSADWQWTSAVSFFGAVDAMFADNIARGVRVTDYVVHSDGTVFGIRGNDRNTSVGVYGVETGIKIRR
jgi:hypothetical protein